MPVQRIGDLDYRSGYRVLAEKMARTARRVAGLDPGLLLAFSGLFGGGPLANASVFDTARCADNRLLTRRSSLFSFQQFPKVVPAGTQPTHE